MTYPPPLGSFYHKQTAPLSLSLFQPNNLSIFIKFRDLIKTIQKHTLTKNSKFINIDFIFIILSLIHIYRKLEIDNIVVMFIIWIYYKNERNSAVVGLRAGHLPCQCNANDHRCRDWNVFLINLFFKNVFCLKRAPSFNSLSK